MNANPSNNHALVSPEDKEAAFILKRARLEFQRGLADFLQVKIARKQEDDMIDRFFSPKAKGQEDQAPKTLRLIPQNQVLHRVRDERAKQIMSAKQAYQKRRRNQD